MATKVDGLAEVPEAYLGSTPTDDAAAGPVETPVNEIVKTAQEAKDKQEKAGAGDGNRTAWIAAGVGVGIGSAALVAALLYANRDKARPKKD